jgi:hypothetical protein
VRCTRFLASRLLLLLLLLLLQSSFDRLQGFVMSIINFYIWIFTTVMGVAQKAFGTVTGETLRNCGEAPLSWPGLLT